MASFIEVIRKASRDIVNPAVRVSKVDNVKKIVYGEVYAPHTVDTHGHAMDAEEIEKMAHGFLIEARNTHIDLMHNNKPVMASVVESFIARKGDPDFNEGAWVLGTKIFDDDLWEEIQKGTYNGYSMEVYTFKESQEVQIQIQNQIFGITEDNDGHNHVYYVKMDDNGVVIGGHTSKDAGHSHDIKLATATEESDEHAHRFVLP